LLGSAAAPEISASGSVVVAGFFAAGAGAVSRERGDKRDSRGSRAQDSRGVGHAPLRPSALASAFEGGILGVLPSPPAPPWAWGAVAGLIAVAVVAGTWTSDANAAADRVARADAEMSLVDDGRNGMSLANTERAGGASTVAVYEGDGVAISMSDAGVAVAYVGVVEPEPDAAEDEDTADDDATATSIRPAERASGLEEPRAKTKASAKHVKPHKTKLGKPSKASKPSKPSRLKAGAIASTDERSSATQRSFSKRQRRAVLDPFARDER
jgi:hypothetical protein